MGGKGKGRLSDPGLHLKEAAASCSWDGSNQNDRARQLQASWKNANLDSTPSPEIHFLCVSKGKWTSLRKQRFALHGELSQKDDSGSQRLVAHSALSSSMIWQRCLCKQLEDHPAPGTVSGAEVSQTSSALGLWWESTVGQLNNLDSQPSSVDDKLPLSIQSVAVFPSDFERFPLFIIKWKAKEFHIHQP